LTVHKENQMRDFKGLSHEMEQEAKLSARCYHVSYI
jgi:hypothetical protein